VRGSLALAHRTGNQNQSTTGTCRYRCLRLCQSVRTNTVTSPAWNYSSTSAPATTATETAVWLLLACVCRLSIHCCLCVSAVFQARLHSGHNAYFRRLRYTELASIAAPIDRIPYRQRRSFFSSTMSARCKQRITATEVSQNRRKRQESSSTPTRCIPSSREAPVGRLGGSFRAAAPAASSK
jgi:hypothetical protein